MAGSNVLICRNRLHFIFVPPAVQRRAESSIHCYLECYVLSSRTVANRYYRVISTRLKNQKVVDAFVDATTTEIKVAII